MTGRGIEFSRVAQSGNSPQLVKSVARDTGVVSAYCDLISCSFRAHSCRTNGTFCYRHFVLILLSSKLLRWIVKHTLVNVPVLSEQMTETAPNVSTVFKDLHNTLFFFIRFAQMVRLAVKAIGSPSRMNAIATLTQSTIKVGTIIQSGWVFRSQEALRAIVSLCFASRNRCQAFNTKQ